MTYGYNKTMNILDGDKQIVRVILAPSRKSSNPQRTKNPWQPRLCVMKAANEKMLKDRSVSVFYVFCYLIQFMDMNNWVRGISVSRIAKGIRKSERTVRKAIDRLYELGIIEAIQGDEAYWFNPVYFFRMKKWNEPKDQLEMRWKARLEYLNEQNDLTRSA